MEYPASDAHTFEREMMPHLEAVLRYARFLCRDRADADDLTQETFMRAFAAQQTYTAGTNARRWLFTICRNLFLRDRQRSERMFALQEEPEMDAIASARLHVAAKQQGYDDVFTRVDLGSAIMRALDDLPDAHRSVVAMIDIEGMSYAEAAEALGVVVGTIRSRLFRGRRSLQQSLIEYARDAGLRQFTGEST